MGRPMSPIGGTFVLTAELISSCTDLLVTPDCEVATKPFGLLSNKYTGGVF